MNLFPHDEPEELISLLAEGERSPGSVAAEASKEIQAELQALQALQAQLQIPAPDDPLSREAACSQVVERIVSLSPRAGGSASAPDSQSRQGLVLPYQLGQYELISLLGQGGMGAVYRARHFRLGKTVAIKVLPADKTRDPQAVARFEREMLAVGKLQHPNIVVAHDAGEVDGTHFLVMELIEGVDLASLARRHGPLPVSAACELIRQAAFGLQHAFEHGMVHRDIKPSNLMLTRPTTGVPPTVKILDLGLALLESGGIEAGAELTSTGQVMGTIDYMAPEQSHNTHQVDIRADIYSLAASLYRLLSGRTPFGGEKYDTVIKRLLALVNERASDIREFRPDCPRELAELIACLLAKNPADRLPQPLDVAHRLRPFCAGADLAALLSEAPLSDQTAILSSGTVSNVSLSQRTVLEVSQADAADPVPLASATGNRRSAIRWGMAAVILAGLVMVSVWETWPRLLPKQTLVAPSSSVAAPVIQADAPAARREADVAPSAPSAPLIVQPSNVATLPAAMTPAISLPSTNSEPGELAKEDLRQPTKMPLASTSGKENPALSGMDARTPADLPEPSALEKWLEGREVLTVKQDGTAMFKTIQAALDAQRAGQVVRVLDQGPYRESLHWNEKVNCGLVTDQQTIVDVNEWIRTRSDAAEKIGHFFENLTNCRLAGFTFRFQLKNQDERNPVQFWNTPGMCFEDCVAVPAGAQLETLVPKVGLYPRTGFPESSPMTVRHCLFLIPVVIDVRPDDRILFTRNWLSVQGQETHGWGVMTIAGSSGPESRNIFVMQNVFTSAGTPRTLKLLGQNGGLRLTLGRNTIFGEFKHPVEVVGSVQSLDMEDTLNFADRNSIAFLNGGQASIEKARQSWKFDRNYGIGSPVSSAIEVPLGDGNATWNIPLLSRDPFDRNYLRGDLNSARVGAKQALPGALTWGPAPAAGDWFTRLQDRWLKIQEDSPSRQPGAMRRSAAEWVVSAGGRIIVKKSDGTRAEVSNRESLPDQSFELQEVHLDGCQKITPAGMALLAQAGPIHDLWLSDSNVDDLSLAQLAPLQACENLRLRWCHFSDAGMVQFARNTKQIQTLELCGTPLSAKTLEQIAGSFPQLKTLLAPPVSDSPEFLTALARYPRLTVLSLDLGQLNPEAVPGLVTSLPELVALGIDGWLLNRHVAAIGRCPQLKQMRFTDRAKFEPGSLKVLFALPQLTQISFQRIVPREAWHELTDSNGLKTLWFYYCSEAQPELQLAAKIPSLTSVRMVGTPFQQSAVDQLLRARPDLEVIIDGRTMPAPQEKSMTGRDVAEWIQLVGGWGEGSTANEEYVQFGPDQPLPKNDLAVTSVYLEESARLTGVSLWPISQLPELELIHLKNSQIGREVVSFLEKCPELKVLEVMNSKLTSSDLAPLSSSLRLLRTLGMNPAQVNDRWELIRKFSALRHIHLETASPEIIDRLCDFSSLRTIWLQQEVDLPEAGDVSRWQQKNQHLRLIVGKYPATRFLEPYPEEEVMKSLQARGRIERITSYPEQATMRPQDVNSGRPYQVAAVTFLPALPWNGVDIDLLRNCAMLYSVKAEQAQRADELAELLASSGQPLSDIYLQRSDLTEAGLKQLGQIESLQFLAVQETGLTTQQVADFRRQHPRIKVNGP